jgi:hypothetical protein
MRDPVVKNRHVVKNDDRGQKHGGHLVDQTVKKPWLRKERREVRGVISASPDHEGLAHAPPRRER